MKYRVLLLLVLVNVCLQCLASPAHHHRFKIRRVYKTTEDVEPAERYPRSPDDPQPIWKPSSRRDLEMERNKKRCERCQEMPRCKTLGKCEQCKIFCREVSALPLAPTHPDPIQDRSAEIAETTESSQCRLCKAAPLCKRRGICVQCSRFCQEDVEAAEITTTLAPEIAETTTSTISEDPEVGVGTQSPNSASVLCERCKNSNLCLNFGICDICKQFCREATEDESNMIGSALTTELPETVTQVQPEATTDIVGTVFSESVKTKALDLMSEIKKSLEHHQPPQTNFQQADDDDSSAEETDDSESNSAEESNDAGQFNDPSNDAGESNDVNQFTDEGQPKNADRSKDVDKFNGAEPTNDAGQSNDDPRQLNDAGLTNAGESNDVDHSKNAGNQSNDPDQFDDAGQSTRARESIDEDQPEINQPSLVGQFTDASQSNDVDQSTNADNQFNDLEQFDDADQSIRARESTDEDQPNKIKPPTHVDQPTDAVTEENEVEPMLGSIFLENLRESSTPALVETTTIRLRDRASQNDKNMISFVVNDEKESVNASVGLRDTAVRYYTVGAFRPGLKMNVLLKLLNIQRTDNIEKLIVIAKTRSQKVTDEAGPPIIIDISKLFSNQSSIEVNKADGNRIDGADIELTERLDKELQKALDKKKTKLGDTHLSPEEIDKIIENVTSTYNQTKTSKNIVGEAATQRENQEPDSNMNLREPSTTESKMLSAPSPTLASRVSSDIEDTSAASISSNAGDVADQQSKKDEAVSQKQDNSSENVDVNKIHNPDKDKPISNAETEEPNHIIADDMIVGEAPTTTELPEFEVVGEPLPLENQDSGIPRLMKLIHSDNMMKEFMPNKPHESNLVLPPKDTGLRKSSFHSSNTEETTTETRITIQSTTQQSSDLTNKQKLMKTFTEIIEDDLKGDKTLTNAQEEQVQKEVTKLVNTALETAPQTKSANAESEVLEELDNTLHNIENIVEKTLNETDAQEANQPLRSSENVLQKIPNETDAQEVNQPLRSEEHIVQETPNNETAQEVRQPLKSDDENFVRAPSKGMVIKNKMPQPMFMKQKTKKTAPSMKKYTNPVYSHIAKPNEQVGDPFVINAADATTELAVLTTSFPTPTTTATPSEKQDGNRTDSLMEVIKKVEKIPDYIMQKFGRLTKLKEADGDQGTVGAEKSTTNEDNTIEGITTETNAPEEDNNVGDKNEIDEKGMSEVDDNKDSNIVGEGTPEPRFAENIEDPEKKETNEEETEADDFSNNEQMRQNNEDGKVLEDVAQISSSESNTLGTKQDTASELEEEIDDRNKQDVQANSDNDDQNLQANENTEDTQTIPIKEKLSEKLRNGVIDEGGSAESVEDNEKMLGGKPSLEGKRGKEVEQDRWANNVGANGGGTKSAEEHQEDDAGRIGSTQSMKDDHTANINDVDLPLREAEKMENTDGMGVSDTNLGAVDASSVTTIASRDESGASIENVGKPANENSLQGPETQDASSIEELFGDKLPMEQEWDERNAASKSSSESQSNEERPQQHITVGSIIDNLEKADNELPKPGNENQIKPMQEQTTDNDISPYVPDRKDLIQAAQMQDRFTTRKPHQQKSSQLVNSPHQNSLWDSENKPTNKQIDWLFNQRPEHNSSEIEHHFGKIVPARETSAIVSNNFPRGQHPIHKVFFVGDNVKLPLQMEHNSDGSVNLKLDVKKICNCEEKCVSKEHHHQPLVGSIVSQNSSTKPGNSEFDNSPLRLTDATNNPENSLNGVKEPMANQGSFEARQPMNDQEDFGEVPFGNTDSISAQNDSNLALEQTDEMEIPEDRSRNNLLTDQRFADEVEMLSDENPRREFKRQTRLSGKNSIFKRSPRIRNLHRYPKSADEERAQVEEIKTATPVIDYAYATLQDDEANYKMQLGDLNQGDVVYDNQRYYKSSRDTNSIIKHRVGLVTDLLSWMKDVATDTRI